MRSFLGLLVVIRNIAKEGAWLNEVVWVDQSARGEGLTALASWEDAASKIDWRMAITLDDWYATCEDLSRVMNHIGYYIPTEPIPNKSAEMGDKAITMTYPVFVDQDVGNLYRMCDNLVYAAREDEGLSKALVKLLEHAPRCSSFPHLLSVFADAVLRVTKTIPRLVPSGKAELDMVINLAG